MNPYQAAANAEVSKFFKNPIVVFIKGDNEDFLHYSFSYFTPVGKPILEKMKAETSLVFVELREGSMNSTATFKMKK